MNSLELLRLLQSRSTAKTQLRLSGSISATEMSFAQRFEGAADPPPTLGARFTIVSV